MSPRHVRWDLLHTISVNLRLVQKKPETGRLTILLRGMIFRIYWGLTANIDKKVSRRSNQKPRLSRTIFSNGDLGHLLESGLAHPIDAQIPITLRHPAADRVIEFRPAGNVPKRTISARPIANQMIKSYGVTITKLAKIRHTLTAIQQSPCSNSFLSRERSSLISEKSSSKLSPPAS